MSITGEADSADSTQRKVQGEAQEQRPVVLVDFAPRAGLKEVSLSPRDVAARSSAALDSAVTSIRQVSERVASATRDLAHQPDEVEVEFGLKLDAATGALIARAGTEAHLTVTLRWGRGGSGV
jgi:preprotein translocase subunit SecD